MKKLDPVIHRLAYQTLIPGLELAIQRLQDELEALKILVAPESASAPVVHVVSKAKAKTSGSRQWWKKATPAQKRRRLEAMAAGKQRREAKAA